MQGSSNKTNLQKLEDNMSHHNTMPGKQKKRQTEGENHRLSADSHYKSYTPYTAFTHTFNTQHMPQYRACHTSNMQYKLPAADRYQCRAHVSLSFLWFGCPTHSARAHTHAYTHTPSHRLSAHFCVSSSWLQKLDKMHNALGNFKDYTRSDI